MSKMLPALPGGFGNLRHVLRSAVESTRGQANELKLPRANKALVIMVDGLGWHNFDSHNGHAPFLRKFLVGKRYCAFPSTTASSITSVATGVTPSEHGIIGYKVFDKETDSSVNFLSGLDSTSAVRFQPKSEDFGQFRDAITVVTKPEYLNSGFSELTFPSNRHVAESDLEARFGLAKREMENGSSPVVYLYVPELDQIAHKFGSKSDAWLAALELLDSLTKSHFANLRQNHGLLLTADHGIVDVNSDQHVYLDECSDLNEQLIDVGGDPRATFLYLKPGSTVTAEQLNLWLAGRGLAMTWGELVQAGLYSTGVAHFEKIAPNLVVFAGNKAANYHRSFAKPASLKMIGQHGGITNEEIAVPIFALGAYSSSLLVP